MASDKLMEMQGEEFTQESQEDRVYIRDASGELAEMEVADDVEHD